MYYRVSTQRKADSMGVVGWVRNCADGTVEITAEAGPVDIQSFLDWCAEGPETAVVTNIEVFDGEPIQCETGFTIRPSVK